MSTVIEKQKQEESKNKDPLSRGREPILHIWQRSMRAVRDEGLAHVRGLLLTAVHPDLQV